MMEPLWGRTVGVPQDQLRVVDDGEAVPFHDLEVSGWHTPGHASHHVAWQIGLWLAYAWPRQSSRGVADR
jgi:glyoxylase-like metal-dependent hydrolase (beta-lactamase superfamily II)